MKLLIKRVLDKNKVDITKIPTQANPATETEAGDAGYDIVATTEPMIKGEFIERPSDGLKVWKKIYYIEYGTNLYWCPVSGAKDFHIELFPRSSISKYNLVLANSVGTIDTGYRNQVMARFKYMFQPEDLVVLPEVGVTRVYGQVNLDAIYQIEDKIVQLKPRENVRVDFDIVDSLPQSSRGLGGFGSSGK